MFRPVFCLFVLVSLTQTGCVHRRLTINSAPSGALVRIDGEDVGYTPTSLDYTWYGIRDVQLLKDGYETQIRQVDISPPWYQRFPFDFVSDNLLGSYLRDHRRFDFRLQPLQPQKADGVIDRGRSLRSEAMHGL